MTRRALVIQHDHVSPPGPVGQRLIEHGYDLLPHEVVDVAHQDTPGVTTRFPDPDSVDLIVAMGARWSAYDDATIGTWTRPERHLLRAADAAGVPVLGICFGGQLLAASHGGTVRASARPELGWVEVDSTDEALVPRGPWFQWHSDTWTVPPDAVEIAANHAGSQAFMLRRNLAVQFHPELTAAMLEMWFGMEGGQDYVREHGADPAALLAETARREAEATERAGRLVDAFLERVDAAGQPAEDRRRRLS